ncbi:MAG: hypothetical protein ACI959_001506, partial [Limisphaerales bacterium]
MQSSAQFASKTNIRTITWAEEPAQLVLSENEVISRPSFENAFFERKDHLPQYKDRVRINGGGKFLVRIESPQFELMTSAEIQLLEGIDIPAVIQPKTWIQTEAKQAYGLFSFLPVRRNSTTGRLEKLVSFTLDYEVIPRSNRVGQGTHSFNRAASNSVLASGTWFKLGVTADGVYKLDKEYLETLGINTASLNPSTIGIFGNGGGMIPVDNGEFRHDDLVENAIRISGETDGAFNDGDFILFYAQGPHRWEYDEADEHFKHVLHSYDDKTYYFLTIDQGTGKRVGTLASETVPATVTVDEFDDYGFVDDDQVNLLQSGRAWYGDFVDALTSERTYTFNFPNRISSEPVWLRANAAARSAVATSNYSFSLNETPVAPMSLSPITIGFDRLYASSQTIETDNNTTGDEVRIKYECTFCDASAKGWLNFIEVNVRRELKRNAGEQLIFRNPETVGLGFISHFIVENSGTAEVWNVTDPTNVRTMELTNTSPLEFRLETDELCEFIAFNEADAYPSSSVEFIGPVANQNLHNPVVAHPDYLVLVHPDFMDQARRLAAHHKDYNGLDTLVTNIFDIYNEFSSGAQDISGLRDYIKFFYDNASTESELPQYVLLFGDGSYDYKNSEYSEEINSNYIPCFQSLNSTHPIFSFTSDDFYGFLDNGEGGSFITSDTMGIDIGIGRLPVRSINQASTVVDKIIHYVEGANYGSWRNTITFVADDEDNNTHIDDSDEIAQSVVAANYPLYNIDKIYLDAYQQISA